MKLITGSEDEGESETVVKVTAGGSGPTLDTQSSGPAQAASAGGPVSRGYKEELEHWAWCIRHPDPANQPRCTPKVAMADAIIALTTNIAVRDRPADQVPQGVVRRDQGRHARKKI